MVIKYLEDHNVPTKAASNKAELNRHLQASLPSLIILDLRLGQDDGLDLLREIRAYSDIPVIITTGHRPDEIDRIVGLELGVRISPLKVLEDRHRVSSRHQYLREKRPAIFEFCNSICRERTHDGVPAHTPR
jgi:DNA-binding response OmpR family regulator